MPPACFATHCLRVSQRHQSDLFDSYNRMVDIYDQSGPAPKLNKQLDQGPNRVERHQLKYRAQQGTAAVQGGSQSDRLSALTLLPCSRKGKTNIISMPTPTLTPSPSPRRNPYDTCPYLPKLGRVNSSPSRKLIHFVQFRDGARDSRIAAHRPAAPSYACSRCRGGWRRPIRHR